MVYRSEQVGKTAWCAVGIFPVSQVIARCSRHHAAEKAKIIAEMDADMRKKLVSEPPALVCCPWRACLAIPSSQSGAAEEEGHRCLLVAQPCLVQCTWRMKLLRSSITVYSTFAHSNPLHADAFPAVARMEAEIVNMTLRCWEVV